MAEVLFSHSYFLRFDPKQWETSKPYAPLGTLYAAAYLRENGHSVAVTDVMFAHGPEEIIPALRERKPQWVVLYDDHFNYLTKMCLTNMREAAWEMSRLAREAGAKVIVCSSDSTDQVEDYLDHHADFIILGEGEETLLDLIRTVESGGDLHKVKGIAFRDQGATKHTEGRPVMRDLDLLPTPAWDLISMRPYQEAWRKHGHFSMSMATTRGCTYSCNWCAKPIWGRRYNAHSAARVADELAMLVREYGAQHIWFCDDIFGLKPGWIQEYAQQLEQRKLKVPYMIQSRADLLLKDDTAQALAASGCDTVWIGAESGSQKILDAMDKGTTIAQIHEARALMKKHRIKTAFFLQFGYLGETQDDIRATFRMLAETMPDDIGVSVSYPLPGTVFYEKVKDLMGSKTHWTDSDDLALMFRNTHSPAFYKRLHRYVHKQFRKLQAFESLRLLLRRPFSAGRAHYRRAMSVVYYIPAAWIEKVKVGKLAH
jgi:radical SAM superfamily enzyme YgiQ (UPF0313 family)